MDPFDRRRAGILLHPTSLPGSVGNGELGIEAYRFIDFLADCQIGLWQMLPLGPTHSDLSPYQCFSVHAGNTRLISLQRLVEAGWLDDAGLDPEQDISVQRKTRLTAAYNGFMRHADNEIRTELDAFIEQHANWLDDFSLYQALRDDFNGCAWFDWPKPLRDRDPGAMEEARRRLASAIEQVQFEQFLFFRQWMDLRHYANDHGVLLFGDIPIFVAYDSADVWANRQWFVLDEQGGLKVVAGVPPDYFSETGQRWGNPHYNWQALADDGYRWWLERIRTQLELFDLMRIDHFRGFEAYWEINAASDTAIDGRWVAGPGADFFEALRQAFGKLPLVAEDLGVITPEVTALRRQFGLPGMKILQFAFDGSSDNPYLPHNHEPLSVVYTGTHDNNTTLGWYEELPEEQRGFVRHYLDLGSDNMPWPLVRTALASVARLSVLPMQDVLALDASHRMNVPGIADGNWQWRFEWEQLLPEYGERLRDWVHLYGRA
ncbi:4-alpha-glucanotransferase [Thiogranum longum]|uniref:4-alpha-glucanotransferase n=1 Tax=Thiogranum longum TaxID=1537524 RepID=A0A4R1HEQ2_9GAMM|nr:4-alpha-glucanotransferase [Thiogranum longum]TCK18805.1 4-alpha-glucanotransferase [Thiogranum longum]